MSATPYGQLIIVGGSEDKHGSRTILRAVAQAAGAGSRIVIVTTATAYPEAAAATYSAIFADLGVAQVSHLDIRTREQAYDPHALAALDGAPVVFFTGGNQLRITSHLGDTPVMQRIRAIYEHGGTIAGTSAGASALGTHMPFEHRDYTGGMNVAAGASSFRVLGGLGFLSDAIVDSHFTQRGRMWRLLTALPCYPQALGLGIDEDTAILVSGLVTGRDAFEVLGRGNVYVVDGGVSLAAREPEEEAEQDEPAPLSLRDVRLHVLGAGDRFMLAEREAVLNAEQPAVRQAERRGMAG